VDEVHDVRARTQQPRTHELREQWRIVGVGAKVAAEVRRVVGIARDGCEPHVFKNYTEFEQFKLRHICS
jgi:hypothetical protein